MKGKIYLSGGGTFEESFKLDDLFLKNTGDRILYLPVGLKRTFAGYDGCVEWFKNMIKNHRVEKKVTTWVQLKNKNSLINIKNFDCIYIGGASDTYRLHAIFKKYNIYTYLKKYSEEGGSIYGGSGGATVLGRTINYDQLNKGLPLVEDYSANLCMDYSVYTHFERKKMEDLEKTFFGDIIVIPETSGLILDTERGEMECVGRDHVFVISNESIQSLEDGEIYKI